MKVAILRNTPAAQVLNPFGRKNREYYRESDIEAVHEVLNEAGHRSEIFEADIDLIPSLETFFGPRGSDGYDDSVAFNLAYGIQGECRYTHIPSLLEMSGVPYVGSGPLAHTICLDKNLAKVVLRHAGLPTPAFQLFTSVDDARRPDMEFPLIVKPVCESTSFGISVVKDDAALSAAVAALLEEFGQAALVEHLIGGTEVNCGVIGNDSPRALPVLEIDFGEGSNQEAILSFEAKRDRAATHVCPADIPEQIAGRVQELAIAAFRSAGCRDAARVDFRIDREGNPYILEINSMVAIHSDGSLFHAAQADGMTYAELILGVLGAAEKRIRGGTAPR